MSIEIKTIKTVRCELEYFTFGFGRKNFVMLPGSSVKSVMLSADAVAEAYAMFNEDYTVWVFDLRKDIPEGYDVWSMSEDVASAMHGLDISDAYVMGVSLGGMLGICLAIKHPELVNRLSISSTIARANEKSNATCTQWAMLAEAGNARELNYRFWNQIYSPEFIEQFRDALEAMADDATKEELDHFARQVLAFNDFDAYDDLDAIKCPVLVTGSWRDGVFSAEASFEIAEKLHCNLIMYAGYSHIVYDEAPDFKLNIKYFFDN